MVASELQLRPPLKVNRIPGYGESISDALKVPYYTLVPGGPGEMRARITVFRPRQTRIGTGNVSTELKIIEGKGTLLYAKGDLSVGQGQSLLIPKGMRYSLTADRHAPMVAYQVAFGDDLRESLRKNVDVFKRELIAVEDELQVGRFADIDAGRLVFHAATKQMVDSDGLGLGLTKQGPNGTDYVLFEPEGLVDAHEHPGGHILFVQEAEIREDGVHNSFLEYGYTLYPLLPGDVYSVHDHQRHAVYNRSKKPLRLNVAGNGHWDVDDPRRLALVS